MPHIDVTIEGPSLHAILRWDGVEQPLARSGNKYTAGLDTTSGTHTYVITVWGPTGEAWTALLEETTPSSTRSHHGSMGPHGQDTTGHHNFVA